MGRWTPPEDEMQGTPGSRLMIRGSGSSLSESEKEAARRLGLSPDAFARGKQAAVRKGLIPGGRPEQIFRGDMPDMKVDIFCP